MKKILMAAIALACFTGGSAVTLRAQEQNPPPKVLLIMREMVKVGKGTAHEKNEAAFARAFAAAKAPDRYLAVTTMSGPSEAWFLEGFGSFADWEKTNKADDEPKISAAVMPYMEKDADYISDGNQTVATFNEKWSYRPAMSMADMRYFEVETIRLRPGHDKDWEDLVTLFKTTADKINMDEHDLFYEGRYGAPAGTIYIFTPRKSLADLDAALGAGKAFQDALGPEGQKKWAQLVEETIANDNTTLVEFSPQMSLPPDAWVKSDPDYWKPKPMAPPKAPAAAPKPAPAPTTKN